MECAIGGECATCGAYFSFEIYGDRNTASLSAEKVESICQYIFDRLELEKSPKIVASKRTKARNIYRDFYFTLRQGDLGGAFFFPDCAFWELHVFKRVHRITEGEAKATAEQLWESLVDYGAIALFAGEEALCPTEELIANGLSDESWRDANAMIYIYRNGDRAGKHLSF